MFKRTDVSAALAIAFGGTIALAALPAWAQQEPPKQEQEQSKPAEPPRQEAPKSEPSKQETQKLDKVEITGSRIASPNASSSAPLQVITSEQIAASGATNVQELLLENPAVGTPGISRTNSNFSTSSAGVSTIDLRDLGTARTLVLVNGRRFVSGVPGSAAVDLNSIPTDFIERVEILTGGSSAAYGSDAVAGVVNIILKRNFQGFALNAHGGRSDQGDDQTKRLSLTFGSNAEGGRGNVMGHIAYSDQGAVNSRDRDISAVDQLSRAGGSGDPADIFTPIRPAFSSFAPQGRFFTRPDVINDPGVTFDRAGNLITFSSNGSATLPASGFNRSEFRTIAVPTERFLLASKGDYSINEEHAVFFEGTYSAARVKSVLEPFPLDSVDIYPATGGFVPAEFLVNGSVVRNPVVPDSIFNLLTDRDGDGLRDYNFTRRLSEVGSRGSKAERDTYRLLTGIKGTVATVWDYELYGSVGSTKESQTSSGQVNVLNFRAALETVPGSNGSPVCRDPHAVLQGCVPINVFGFNSISPEALAYVTAPGSLNTLTKQQLFGGTITGEAATLPAGPVGVALGFEYRDEFSRSEFDALTQAGLNAGNAIPPTVGSFDVKDLFAELRVPLLKDAGLAKSLTATAGVRRGQYSTIGNALSWNAGLDWTLNSSVKVRASRALSTRAPDISELFQPPSQTFPPGLVDPCVGVTALTQGATADACRADPGVAANIAANGSFKLNQADIQGISGFDRGNPKVSEEKGNSWSLGLAITPESFKNVAFTIDYFKINIADAIVSTPRQFSLDQCYGGDASFCQFVTRRPTASGTNSPGSIEFIDQTVTNSGEMGTSGVDLTGVYRGNLGQGMLGAQLSYTYVKDGYLTPLPGSARDEFRGEVGSAAHKASLGLNYKWAGFGVFAQTTYIGSSALDDQFLARFDLPAGSVKVPAQIYNDFQFTYSPQKSTEFYIGVDNAFDRAPPPVISGLPGNVTGTETAADVYDAIGRRYYAGVRIKF